MCCVWSRQEAERFCLTSAVIGHCQPRRWAEEDSTGYAGWGPYPGHVGGSKAGRVFYGPEEIPAAKARQGGTRL